MFKLVVLSCLVSVAFGGYVHAPASIAYEKTIVEPQLSVVETPTVNHVASIVKSVPSAHSYQSQTQYHSKTVAEPVYAHGVQKTVVSTPVVKQYVEQVPAVVPVAKVISEPYYAKTVVAAPSYYAAAPAHYASYAAAPVAKTISYAAAPVAYAAAPAHYSSAVYAPKALNYAAAYPSAYSAYSAYPAASYAQHW